MKGYDTDFRYQWTQIVIFKDLDILAIIKLSSDIIS